MKTETQYYSLSQARKVCQWYKETYGIDHSQLIGFHVPGTALNDLIEKLHAGKLGRNEAHISKMIGTLYTDYTIDYYNTNKTTEGCLTLDQFSKQYKKSLN